MRRHLSFIFLFVMPSLFAFNPKCRSAQTTPPIKDCIPENGNMPALQETMNEDPRYGISFSGSFLYWIAREDGLEYVMTGAENDLGVPVASRGSTYRPDFKWGPGYRVGLAYRKNHDWDLCFTWTDFRTNARDSRDNPMVVADDINNPLWSIWTAPGGLGAAVNLAEANWDLNYWTAELMTGVMFHPRKNFSLKPSVGVLGAGIKQNYDITYTASSNTVRIDIDMGNKFYAGGMRGAFDICWEVNRYLDFSSRAGFSLLFGKFLVTNTETTTQPYNPVLITGNLTGKLLDVENDFHSAKASVDFTAGFHLAYPFYCDKYVLSLDGAWNLILWFDQNQMMRFLGPDSILTPQSFRGHYLPQQGDLFIQGLDLTASFEF